jgi:hypothetical protein
MSAGIAVPLGVSVLAAVVCASPASAAGYAHFDDTQVTVFPGCSGTTSAEAMVAPLQQGNRVENGVAVAVHFSSDNRTAACALDVGTTWRNRDTGASGRQSITVASTADPASGGHYGSAGYSRGTLWTGPGRVVVTVSTHPGSAREITV